MHLAADRRLVETCRRQSADAVGERRLAAWLLLAAIVSFAALALPFLLGRVYVADDLGEFHLPLRDFYARQLAQGESFDWMPSLYGGFYVTGEGQLGGYHPLHLFLYRWLPLAAAFDLELLASYPIMFAGTYCLLNYWLGRRDAALFGALAFTFSGFNLLHFVHPNAVAIVAHIPWLLLAIDLTLGQPRGPRTAMAELAVGLLVASQLLLGYPQYVWFSLLVAAAYAAWRTIGLQAPWPRVAVLVLVAMLGVVAGAIQWLPTLDALGTSTRSASDASFADTGALHPLNLVQLVAPYLFGTRVVGQNTHELGLYTGTAPLLLCVWLLTQRRCWGRYAPLVWAALACGGIALVLAFGQAGGLYRLQTYLPGVGHFRFPCRAIVLVQFSIAVTAAAAVAVMQNRPADVDWAATRRADRWLAMAFAAAVVLAIVGPLAWPDFVARPLLVWCGPALVGAAALLIALAERRVHGALVVLALFTAVDLCCYGLSYSVWQRTAELSQFVADAPLPPGGAPVRVAAHNAGTLRTGNRMLLAGVSRIDGYAGLEPAKRLDYRTEGALRLAGAQFTFAAPSADNPPSRTWERVPQPAPRSRLVTRVVPFERIAEAALPNSDVAAVDEPFDLPASAAGTAQIRADRPGRIAVACNAPARQLLVTTESFHSGWQATVDGRVEPVVRVNGDFLGCAVDGGVHEVEFRFRPGSLLLGECLSAGGLGLLVCAVVLSAQRGKARTE